MNLFEFKTSGNFNNLERFLMGAKKARYASIMEDYARRGVEALSAATPRDSGRTAESWYYNIISDHDGFLIEWCNDNIQDGFNVAVGIQYGHATGTGGYVNGVDYINPAMHDILEGIVKECWEELQNG